MPSVLMCRPTHYGIRYEINPWMHLRHPARHARAVRQWLALYRTLRRLKVRVRLLRPQAGLPDLVFTANAGLVAGRSFIRSNFRFPQRRGEEPIVERYFRARGLRIVRLPRRCTFEGEGDALWLGSTLVLGFRFRSDAPAHARLSSLLRREVLPVELADPRFYHLDTCFCPLNERSALWYPKAFDRYGRRVLERAVPDLIAVSERDALTFCCNAIPVGRDVILPQGASVRLRRALSARRLTLHPVELSEFLKAGGAAKCLVLWLSPLL